MISDASTRRLKQRVASLFASDSWARLKLLETIGVWQASERKHGDHVGDLDRLKRRIRRWWRDATTWLRLSRELDAWDRAEQKRGIR